MWGPSLGLTWMGWSAVAQAMVSAASSTPRSPQGCFGPDQVGIAVAVWNCSMTSAVRCSSIQACASSWRVVFVAQASQVVQSWSWQAAVASKQRVTASPRIRPVTSSHLSIWLSWKVTRRTFGVPSPWVRNWANDQVIRPSRPGVPLYTSISRSPTVRVPVRSTRTGSGTTAESHQPGGRAPRQRCRSSMRWKPFLGLDQPVPAEVQDGGDPVGAGVPAPTVISRATVSNGTSSRGRPAAKTAGPR